MPPPSPKVLIVDDDANLLAALGQIFGRVGWGYVAIANELEGMAVGRQERFDVVLLDVRLPHIGGLELLRHFREQDPGREVVMMTAHGSIPTAVEAVRAGAFDYLTKPFASVDLVTQTVLRAFEARQRRGEAPAQHPSAFTDGLIGDSPKLREVLRQAQAVASSHATVLVQGESGTGKGLVAHAIHRRSSRANGPFVTVSCGSLSEALFESELFGHVAGAFTGANQDARGLFGDAHGGTIFLDEVAELTAPMQAKLLRVLQDGEVRPVGGTTPRKLDVRVISASHVDLGEAVARGELREDLFYRLNVVTLRMPPLRECPGDLPTLVRHFMERASAKTGRKVMGIAPEALDVLSRYRWPGNVRELEHLIERGVVMARGATLRLKDLMSEVPTPSWNAAEVDVMDLAHLPWLEAKRLAVTVFERHYLTALLAKHGTVAAAARAANVDRANFRRLLKAFGVMRPASDKEGDDDRTP